MTDVTKFLYKKIFDSDDSRGPINVYNVQKVFVCSESIEYPNIRFQSVETNDIINPIFEKTMSLSFLDNDDFFRYQKSEVLSILNTPMFFMCFNFDNYFHFIYDSLPYFLTYFEIKKEIPNLKILIPKTNLKKFVIETFELLGIDDNDRVVISNNYLYEKIYFSDSYTHGENSNKKPHKSSLLIYEKLIKLASTKTYNYKKFNKIYVSRRSWIHGDLSNIGTNYTDRRILTNETEVVNLLEKDNISEIFTENMSMSDKINLFNKAELVIGPIGGGLVNCIFSKKNCNLLVINSPTFLDVNMRFLFSFDNVNFKIYDNCYHVDDGVWKINQRVYVKNKNVFGEIIKISENKLLLNFTDEMISGFSKENFFKSNWFLKKDCTSLDDGLNSPFKIDIENFKNFMYKSIL
jgi:capsular polysaccharide biosynthesis protein